jgi:hypothetical protein
MPANERESIMKSERTLLSSIFFLILGLGLIFGYCHDSTVSFGVAYPVSGASLDVVIKTAGLPAMAGVASTLLGVLLLIIATIQAIMGQVSWPAEKAKPQRSPAA